MIDLIGTLHDFVFVLSTLMTFGILRTLVGLPRIIVAFYNLAIERYKFTEAYSAGAGDFWGCMNLELEFEPINYSTRRCALFLYT